MRDDQGKNQSTMQNPATQYPKPPFPQQPQGAPGTVHKMQPQPDHGETTYQGSGRLQGRKALITGGDSGIGRAVAIAFAREGADVAIVYLPAEEQDAQERHGNEKPLSRHFRESVHIDGHKTVERHHYCQAIFSTSA